MEETEILTNTDIQSDNKKTLKKAIMRFGILAFVYSLMRLCAGLTLKGLDAVGFFGLFPQSWQSAVEMLIGCIFFYFIPLIPFFILFPRKLYKRNNKTYIGSEYTKPKAFSFYPAVYSLGILTSALTILLLIAVAYLMDIKVTSDNITNYFSEEHINIFVQLLITAVFVPIMEEFFFRGVMLGSLRPFGDRFAIFASGLFFGLMHGNILQAPFATIIGFALGYIYVRSNSLKVTIGFHMLVNGTATILSYFSLKSVDFIFGKSLGKVSKLDGVNYVIAFILEMVLFAVIICGVISLVKQVIKYIVSSVKKVRISYLENKCEGVTEPKKLLYFFTNPFVLLGLGFCLFYIISSTVNFINSCNPQ